MEDGDDNMYEESQSSGIEARVSRNELTASRENRKQGLYHCDLPVDTTNSADLRQRLREFQPPAGYHKSPPPKGRTNTLPAWQFGVRVKADKAETQYWLFLAHKRCMSAQAKVTVYTSSSFNATDHLEERHGLCSVEAEKKEDLIMKG